MNNILKSIIILCFSLWIGGFFYFIYRINSYPINTHITDLIVLFSGGKKRLDTAINLLKSGYAPILFITGIQTSNQLTNFFKENNISEEQIVLSYDQYNNTLEYAQKTANFVHIHNIGSLRLVTSRYNMPIALLELSKLIPHQTTIIPHPVSLDSREYYKTFKEYNYYLIRLIKKFFKKIVCRLFTIS